MFFTPLPSAKIQFRCRPCNCVPDLIPLHDSHYAPISGLLFEGVSISSKCRLNFRKSDNIWLFNYSQMGRLRQWSYRPVELQWKYLPRGTWLELNASHPLLLLVSATWPISHQPNSLLMCKCAECKTNIKITPRDCFQLHSTKEN